MLTYTFFQSDAAIIPLIFLFFAFYDLAYTPMLVAYTLEILPFRIRAKGFAVMVNSFFNNPLTTLFFSASTRLFVSSQNSVTIATVAFNQFVNPWAIDAIGWHYYLVYCGWLVIELLFIIFFIVETRGIFFHVSCMIPMRTKYFFCLHRPYTGRNGCDIRWR